MEVIILLAVLDALNVASVRWGCKSKDGLDSPEWQPQQRWYGFH
jgi:hypothetical protein